MNAILKIGLPLIFTSLAASHEATAADAAKRTPEALGRHLILIAGCNDCHTVGYAEASGRIPDERWLTGSAVGFSGPWGTTYPSNLRLTVRAYSEQDWIAHARSAMRPPMPSPSLVAMTDDELRAIYRFIRRLGPAGSPAPAYVQPGDKVTTPSYDFVPRGPAGQP
ncbi:MAG: c-type cytochrome [Pseudomonadota bacterium]